MISQHTFTPTCHVIQLSRVTFPVMCHVSRVTCLTSTSVSRRLMMTLAVGLVQAGCDLAAKIREILLVFVTTAA